MESISLKKRKISTKEMIVCSIFAALIAIMGLLCVCQEIYLHV